MTPEDFNLIPVNPHSPLCEAWRAAFDKQSEVEIRQCRFEDLETIDCMVSAANSFGLMDGGVSRVGDRSGRVMPCEAAHQMAIAYHHFRQPPTALNWRVADRFQKAIGEGPGPG